MLVNHYFGQSRALAADKWHRTSSVIWPDDSLIGDLIAVFVISFGVLLTVSFCRSSVAVLVVGQVFLSFLSVVVLFTRPFPISATPTVVEDRRDHFFPDRLRRSEGLIARGRAFGGLTSRLGSTVRVARGVSILNELTVAVCDLAYGGSSVSQTVKLVGDHGEYAKNCQSNQNFVWCDHFLLLYLLGQRNFFSFGQVLGPNGHVVLCGSRKLLYVAHEQKYYI